MNASFASNGPNTFEYFQLIDFFLDNWFPLQFLPIH